VYFVVDQNANAILSLSLPDLFRFCPVESSTGDAFVVAAIDHRNKSEGDSEKVVGVQRQRQKIVIAGLVPAIHAGGKLVR
jgi:hypothetical protein